MRTGTRSSGIGGGASSSAQRGLQQVGEPLRGRVDDGVRHRMERTLSEGREDTHLLDLVAEELDPQGLAAGRREDVDDAAADRELAPLLRPLDALVAGERQVLRHRLDARLLADRQPDRLRPVERRRHALRECGGRRADEAAAGEDVECPSPLADEMRRRLEARAPVDAAARQQGDVLGTEEPPGRLGRVAGVRVLRQEAHERPFELLVQRGEQERQHGLGDPCTGGERGGELLQGLVRAERGDEGVEHGTVHDRRRNRWFRGGHRSRGRQEEAGRSPPPPTPNYERTSERSSAPARL